jgi:hypothetical protein
VKELGVFGGMVAVLANGTSEIPHTGDHFRYSKRCCFDTVYSVNSPRCANRPVWRDCSRRARRLKRK